jgi:hypothetical protein
MKAHARLLLSSAIVASTLITGATIGSVDSVAGAAATTRQSSDYAMYTKCIAKANRQKTPRAKSIASKKCLAARQKASGSTTVPVVSTSSAGATGPLTPPAVSLGGCSIFPSDNPWNQRVDTLPLNAQSDTWVNTLGRTRTLHPDFGGPYGIPFSIVPASQAKVPIAFTAYGDESDPGPYPIPLDAPIEGGPASDGDRHVLVLQSGDCKLYELGRAFPTATGWNADVGAVFNLSSNALRPERWTSADAAGLPITAGLVRFEDIASGSLNHAVRFTAQCTQRAYIHPATHQAGKNDASCPPMGARFRLKASFDTAGYTGQTRIILEGLKAYGMIVADNGSNWFVTGAVDSRWNVADLEQLKRVPGSVFEVVDTGPLIR